MISLNPCCSGQWSRTAASKAVVATMANVTVLILVVVDNGLVQVAAVASAVVVASVLILVVVDNGLVQLNKARKALGAPELS